MSQHQYKVDFLGGDSVTVDLTIDGQGQILKSTWTVIGSLALLEACQKMKPALSGAVENLQVPAGTLPENLMLKKLILKIKGQWLDEESDPELCHCRKIPQSSVERAIIYGAHTVEKIRQRTAANTGCGTCLPDVETVLEAYLK